MVPRKRQTRRGNKAEVADPNLLTRAARMVGTALGSISVKVRGKQSGEVELSKAGPTKSPRKAAAKKKAVRKAGTKAVPKKRKNTATRAKKDALQQ